MSRNLPLTKSLNGGSKGTVLSLRVDWLGFDEFCETIFPACSAVGPSFTRKRSTVLETGKTLDVNVGKGVAALSTLTAASPRSELSTFVSSVFVLKL